MLGIIKNDNFSPKFINSKRQTFTLRIECNLKVNRLNCQFIRLVCNTRCLVCCFQLTAVCFNNGTEVPADVCIQGVGKVALVYH